MSNTALELLTKFVAEHAAQAVKDADSAVDRAKDALLEVEGLSKQAEDDNEQKI